MAIPQKLKLGLTAAAVAVLVCSAGYLLGGWLLGGVPAAQQPDAPPSTMPRRPPAAVPVPSPAAGLAKMASPFVAPAAAAKSDTPPLPNGPAIPYDPGPAVTVQGVFLGNGVNRAILARGGATLLAREGEQTAWGQVESIAAGGVVLAGEYIPFSPQLAKAEAAGTDRTDFRSPAIPTPSVPPPATGRMASAPPLPPFTKGVQ